jgi:hypothetical protein
VTTKATISKGTATRATMSHGITRADYLAKITSFGIQPTLEEVH